MANMNTPYGILDADHAAELLSPPSNSLDRQVLAHFQRWQAVGIFLRCVACGHSQKASDSAQPFPHDPHCRAASAEGEFPWRELADLLQHLPY